MDHHHRVLIAGLIVVGAAVLVDLLRPRDSDPEPSSQWMRERRDADAQFARLMICVACLVGLPLIVGGLVRAVVDQASVVGWAAMAVAVLPGVLLLRLVWDRWPDRRLDPVWWERQAQIGDGGRRRSITVLAVALGFVIVCGALMAVL